MGKIVIEIPRCLERADVEQWALCLLATQHCLVLNLPKCHPPGINVSKKTCFSESSET